MPEEIFTSFENYIRAYDLFSDAEIATIKSLAVPKWLKKRQYLLCQGSVCRHHTFVCAGCLRSYRIDDEGGEHIIGLSAANQWVNDPVSLLSGSPSLDFIDALEDTALIQFSTHSFKTLLETIPRFSELNNKIIKDFCDICTDRIFMMLSLQAEERYREFIKVYPGLHERIPIYMIASYLGVSRETLTRIRSNMLNL